MEQIRLGIIGMGNMGSGHLQSIIDGQCPRITVTAAADINPERLEFVKAKCPRRCAMTMRSPCWTAI